MTESDNRHQYTADDIQSFTLVEAIRKRPAMYLGGTDFCGFVSLVIAAFDFLLDHEASWTEVEVTDKIRFRSDASVPAQLDESDLLQPFEAFSEYQGKPLRYLPDGAMLVALSEHFRVVIDFNGTRTEYASERGERKKLVQEPSPGSPTAIEFELVADSEIFPMSTLSPSVLHSYCRRNSYLHPGVRYCVKGEETIAYFSERGLPDMFNVIATPYQLLHQPIHIQEEKDGLSVEAVFVFHNQEESRILSFANKRRVPNGGSHEDGLLDGIASFSDRIQPSTYPGLFAVLAIDCAMVPYAGATREKVSDPEFRKQVQNLVCSGLANWAKTNEEELNVLASIKPTPHGGVW